MFSLTAKYVTDKPTCSWRNFAKRFITMYFVILPVEKLLIITFKFVLKNDLANCKICDSQVGRLYTKIMAKFNSYLYFIARRRR